LKTLSVLPLTKEAFEKYGSYTSPFCQKDYCFDGGFFRFHRDAIQQNLSRESVVSYSVCEVLENPSHLVSLEFHDNCEELIMPLDGDMVMVVGPAVNSTDCPVDQLEAFFVPCGTYVKVRCGVWHGIPFKTNDNPLHILCALPERTYRKDCFETDLQTQEMTVDIQ
jgi:ureidoglycolate hydrolase